MLCKIISEIANVPNKPPADIRTRTKHYDEKHK